MFETTDGACKLGYGAKRGDKSFETERYPGKQLPDLLYTKGFSFYIFSG